MQICFVLVLISVIFFYFVVFGPWKDYFQKQNILQGPFQKSKYFVGTIFLQNRFSHHVSHVQNITKVGSEIKTKTRHICKDQKLQNKFTGTKTKMRHICRDQNHILANNKCYYLLVICPPHLQNNRNLLQR